MTPAHKVQFLRGIQQFNEGQFFEAHETWEEIWLSMANPDRGYLQGIIQIAAAFHHYKRNNLRGTRSLIQAGLLKLDSCPVVHFGISIELLRRSAGEWSDSLAAGRNTATFRVPTITVA